jgi:hypothetical protein
MKLGSFILLFASFHLTGLYALEEVILPFEFRLMVLAYPDDLDLRAAMLTGPEGGGPSNKSVGTVWVTGEPEDFVPYPFAPNDKYRRLNAVPFRKVSLDRFVVILHDVKDDVGEPNSVEVSPETSHRS